MSVNNSPKLIAHRGGSKENPENTVKAFKQACKSENIDGVELDVRESSDGVLVVYHDKNLKSLTDKKGIISETHSSEVLSAEVLNSGETVPTLDQVLKTIPATMEITIELKQPGIQTKVAEKASKISQIVTITPYNISEIRELAKYNLRTAYLLEERKINKIVKKLPLSLPDQIYFPEDIDTHVKKASSLECDVIQCRMETAKRTDIVSQAHKYDLDVEVWTMKNRTEYCQLVETGVDSIMTDIYDKPAC